jgi:hypothetical protein
VYVNTFGEAMVLFDERMLISPDYRNITTDDLKIRLWDSNTRLVKKDAINYWNVTLMTNTKMYIKINWKSPKDVSSYQEPDNLRITFLNPSFFYSEETMIPIEKDLVIRQDVAP